MNTKLRYVALFYAITLALALSIPSFGQVAKGSIYGSVIDPQGAVVSGAQVKANNLESDVVFTTTTGSSGIGKKSPGSRERFDLSLQLLKHNWQTPGISHRRCQPLFRTAGPRTGGDGSQEFAGRPSKDRSTKERLSEGLVFLM